MSSLIAAVNPRYFLNRLALEHGADCFSSEPIMIVQRSFNNDSLCRMQEMFEEFCEAAVAPAYYWKDRDPEILLRFSGELEKLIEVSFLLYRNRKSLPVADLPKTIRDFFIRYSLAEWKRILRDWTRAALSTCSVAEVGRPQEMIPFVNGIEDLLKTMKLLSGNLERMNAGKNAKAVR